MRRFIYTFIIALIFAATGVSAEEEKLNGNCQFICGAMVQEVVGYICWKMVMWIN